MKTYFCKNFLRSITLVIFLISLKGDFLNAENLFEEINEVRKTTKDIDLI